MRYLLCSLLFAGTSALAQDAAPVSAQTAPLACAHCGQWTLAFSAGGWIGERVSITPGRVAVPGFDDFCAVIRQQSVDSSGSQRAYRITLGLSQPEADCSADDPDALRMELEVTPGFREEGSFAHMQIFKPSMPVPVFEGSGWNFAREDPCEASGSGPNSSCRMIHHAAAYKRLAYVAHVALDGLPPRQAAAFVRSFNPAAFAYQVKLFCEKREAGRGGGSWPAYWSLICQEERIDSKLAQFEALLACRKNGRSACVMPGPRFDKSPASEN